MPAAFNYFQNQQPRQTGFRSILPYYGIYSCGGWSGGKMAYLLGTSVSFPNGNSDSSHCWTRNSNRQTKLKRAINLGCKKKLITQGCVNYNSEFTQDKLAVWRAFDEQNIPHPEPLLVEDIVRSKNETVFLGRKNNSSRGRGIVKYTRKEWLEKQLSDKKADRPEHDFYVEFLEFKSEHRIHVLHGEIVCELNKVVENRDNFIHTAEQGCPLELGKIDHKEIELIKDYAIKSIKACKLDLGAVDIFIDTNDKIYILEVNSDPGMPGGIGYFYAQRFSIYEGLGGLSNYNVKKNGEIVKYGVKK